MIRALIVIMGGIAAWHFGAAPAAELLLERMFHLEQVISTL